MSDEFTVGRLRQWGEAWNAAPYDHGYHLLRYAEAWETEVHLLETEIALLRYLLRNAPRETHD